MGWISVDDAVPATLTKVLAYDTQRIYICYRENESEYNEHWTVGEPHDEYLWGCTGAITHWMPLPEPPKSG